VEYVEELDNNVVQQMLKLPLLLLLSLVEMKELYLQVQLEMVEFDDQIFHLKK
jgi:hypothetical protein